MRNTVEISAMRNSPRPDVLNARYLDVVLTKEVHDPVDSERHLGSFGDLLQDFSIGIHFYAMS